MDGMLLGVESYSLHDIYYHVKLQQNSLAWTERQQIPSFYAILHRHHEGLRVECKASLT